MGKVQRRTLNTQKILEVNNLRVGFISDHRTIFVLNGVDFTLHVGEILGIVGESGCGKSMTLLSILRLIPRTARILDGKILYDGRNLLSLSMREMRRVRGAEIAMIFQDPMTTLNPVFPIGEQIRESLRLHHLMDSDLRQRWPFASPSWGRQHEERTRVLEVMREVGIPAPEARYRDYPHQFSGGMQQRALIAIALACRPRVLLADEPTTALDVTIQAQILSLMRQINREHGTSIILVTHDLAVAAEFCDRIAVMYAGRIVESGRTEDVLFNPQHPYTKGLLRSIPRIQHPRRLLEPIPGEVPDLAQLPERGCPFAPRCYRAVAACQERDPPWIEVLPGHYARCLRVQEAEPGVAHQAIQWERGA